MFIFSIQLSVTSKWTYSSDDDLRATRTKGGVIHLILEKGRLYLNSTSTQCLQAPDVLLLVHMLPHTHRTDS